MAIVTLKGASSISPLIHDRHLSEVPEAELVAILVETLGRETADSLTHAMMQRVGIPEFTTANIIRAYCKLSAPGGWHNPAYIAEEV